MNLCTFFVVILATLANSSYLQDKQVPAVLKPRPIDRQVPAVLKPRPIDRQVPTELKPRPTPKKIRLASADPPIDITPHEPHPKIAPRQATGSCSNVNFAFSGAGQTAVLQSPNYPNDYPYNWDCDAYIASPAGTTMTITCDINVDCNDALYYSLSGDSDFNDAESYCGRGTTSPETTNGNSLAIGFQSGNYRRYSSTPYRYSCTITTSGSAPGPAPGPVPAPAPAPAPAPSGSCSCGVRNVNGATRIVGGAQTKTGEYPWRVLVFIYNPSTGSGYICGGTIISASWVMTAAHCTAGMKSTDKINVYTEAQANSVTVGGGVTNAVDRYVQHPSYTSQTMDNDITLVHLTKPLTFKSNVSPVCLPWNLVSKNFSGTSVQASGWGTTKPVPINTQNNDASSNTLMGVTLPVLTTEECRKYMPSITNNMICTYKPGSDTCQGDSGGSIDYQDTNTFYYSVGVVSFGDGCAQSGHPGVYTKVINYLPWITTTTGDNSFCRP